MKEFLKLMVWHLHVSTWNRHRSHLLLSGEGKLRQNSRPMWHTPAMNSTKGATHHEWICKR
eukprot:5844557-Karenia_brevis.AAC.1